MVVSIFPLTSLTSLSQVELVPFGVKTAGVVDLMNAVASSPCPYTVPDGWAMPAGEGGKIDTTEIRRAFDDLTGKMGGKGALLIRSSALDEEPGQNKTKFVGYHHDGAEQSFARFCEAIREVGGRSETMGVLLMPLVGALSVLADGREALGNKGVLTFS